MLKGLDEELSKASFVSFDTEFTGLNDHESLDGKLQPLGNIQLKFCSQHIVLQQ